MSRIFEQRLGEVAAREVTLTGGLKGIEKESLRVDAGGYLAQTPHPESLGSALTNTYITTDFSEALLEFVTSAFPSTWEALRAICDIHQFTYENLGDELLWVASMPCRIPADREIPLALYGDSNVGQMKTVYRRGLGHRYGRHMQTIAGVHFNYSLPQTFWPAYSKLVCDDCNDDDVRSEYYMGMVRNFRRLGWIILYLFGASPALCKSFAGSRDLGMPALNDSTWYEPYGTSLRMSDLGYNNQTQSTINISLNNVDEYIRDLTAAIHTPNPAYELIGVKVNGRYEQLNANILQIENEYYSTVRPKRVAYSGERPTHALRRGGIEYVEIRSLDINLFDPCGINQNTMRFIEAFLIYCLLEESPLLDDDALVEARENQLVTARRGREPGVRLLRGGKQVALADWATQIVECTRAVAELIDAEATGNSYAAAVDEMRGLVEDPETTPSARIIEELRRENLSFFELAMQTAKSHRDYFASITALPDERRAEMTAEAADSLARQRAIEAADSISFDEYLENYFSAD
ncbi:MAG: glutamate--cysteine ligase [Woeseiaceae bacterium]|nr:glutamate--cysteine ligase [Woeseiaceae bacterium]